MNPFQLLDQIISLDVGSRGIAHLRCDGDLAAASAAILDARKIGIVTGFYVASAGAGETDGPAGAIALSHGLAKIGKLPVLITDARNLEIVSAGVGASGDRVAQIITFPSTNGPAFSKMLFDEHDFDCLIFIERVGPAADGVCYDAAGNPISAYTAPTHLLLDHCTIRGIATIGIGDGGNEIGMGKVIGNVRRYCRNGPTIGCVSRTDHLLAAGVSNWGAWGLLAGVSLLAGESVLPSVAFETRVLEALVRAGAVDAVSKKNELTVDGLNLARYFDVLDQLDAIVAAGISVEARA